jgi:hypothetical protein
LRAFVNCKHGVYITGFIGGAGDRLEGALGMRSAFVVLGAVLTAIVLGPAAFAQQTPGADTPLSTPVLDATLSAEALYNSNVAASDEQIAASRGLQLQDEIFTPTLSVNVVRPFGRGGFFLTGDAGYDFYDRNTILDRERLDLHTGIGDGVGQCQGRLTGSFSRHQSNLDDLTLAVVRNVEDDTSVAFSGSCPRTIGFVPSVSVSQDWASNSNPFRLSSDYRTLVATAGLAYTRPVFGVLSVYGEYDQTVFPNRLLLIGASALADSYQLYSGGVRYDRKLGARIEATFSLAYTSLQSDIPGAAGFNGLTYAADVTFQATGKIGAHVHFERAAKPSNRIDTTYTIQEDYLAEVTYAISPRTSLKFGGLIRTRDFAGPTLVSTIDLTHEQLDTIYGTLSVNLSRRLTFLLDIREEDRRSSLSAYNYDSARISLTATTTF